MSRWTVYVRILDGKATEKPDKMLINCINADGEEFFKAVDVCGAAEAAGR